MTINRENREIARSVMKVLVVLTLSLLGSLLIAGLGAGKESILMMFLLGVLFVTILTNGYIYGIAASVAGVVLFDFFFTEPRYAFLIYSAVDVMLLLFFLVTAVVSGTITSRLQKQISISHQSELTARLLYKVAEDFLHITGKRNIILRGIKYIYDHTGYASRVILDGDDQEYFSEQYAQSDREGLTIPIQGVAKQMGSLTLYCGRDELTFQQELVVKTVATQLGAALDREYSYREREEIRVAMERERLRSTLLRSVAHDLRTPLTALTGASSLLTDKFEQLSLEEQKKLAADISEEMIWLANFVENILNMTRIGEGQLFLHKEDEVVDDVVNEATSHMSRILQNRHLEVSLPNEVISLPMDGKLVVQVLVNLLDNAVKHTPLDSCIDLKVGMLGNDVVFEVCDNGNGIAEDIMDRLFDRFTTQKNNIIDGKRGMGLGLAICKAIVEAHGGAIRAENQPAGGARFVFSLPNGGE
ncbi:Sensor protein KdpD [Desulfitobacterium hafniense]|uniref:histidine kinase n=1 Tax=Desulfitobacterium hafniense TaxID=49338 RepID=A0A098B4X7_DESHA|nr:ATP-binding protein [Desulfitobacterium hafniense]CDX03928.1 Sensor protein KdpD [Desulfitobacterium hafniense]